MFSVGETLRRARLKAGLDLSAVSARTKIAARFLEAIEADDRKCFPSGFFYRSFVEQYARQLSLDTAEINAEIDRMLAADAPLPLPGQDGNPVVRVPPVKIRSRFRSRLPMASFATLILVVAGCSGIYAWWRTGRFDIYALLAAMSDDRPPAVEAAKPQETGKPAAVTVSAQPAEQPVAQTPAAASPVADSTAAADSKVLVDLVATERTWLSVQSDGKPVFSGIMAPNQTKTIAGKQFAKLRIGNAAGVAVRLNGKPLGPLGGRGQVLVVVFTPDKYQIVALPKEGA